MNLLLFQEQFRSEDDCHQWLFNTRWPNGFYCPACGHEKYSLISTQKTVQVYELQPSGVHYSGNYLPQGNATLTFKKCLDEHPERIIALAYFDFDIYEPTKICLELCRDRFTRGSIIGFDELNHPDWPNETLALKEVLGLDKVRIERLPFMPTASFIVID